MVGIGTNGVSMDEKIFEAMRSLKYQLKLRYLNDGRGEEDAKNKARTFLTVGLSKACSSSAILSALSDALVFVGKPVFSQSVMKEIMRQAEIDVVGLRSKLLLAIYCYKNDKPELAVNSNQPSTAETAQLPQIQ